MSRGQRWRMISSIGAGLPPSGLQITDLPNPGSRGAVVLQTYCARCHQLPAPQMHAAAEWPVLVRRMVLRAMTLRDRMGGPVMHDMLGDVLMGGMSSAEVPTSEEVDSLVAYLQAHAMPTADPEQLGTGPEAELFQETCSRCHEVPDPAAHTPAEWGAVVARMRMNAGLLGTPSITADEADRIVTYLTEISAS
jgi:cytochrome c5